MESNEHSMTPAGDTEKYYPLPFRAAQAQKAQAQPQPQQAQPQPQQAQPQPQQAQPQAQAQPQPQPQPPQAQLFQLNMELMQMLDVQVGRMVGLLKDARYQKVVEEYGLDLVQSLLWLDVAQLLGYILDQNGYEEMKLTNAELGLEAKKALASRTEALSYIKALLHQYNCLHFNEQVGQVLKETVEDIQSTYKLIEKALAGILTSQKEIDKLVHPPSA